MADFETGDVVRLAAVTKFDLLYDIVNVYHVVINAGGPLDFASASVDFQQYLDALYQNISALQVNNVKDDSIGVKNVTQGTVWGAIAWNSYTGGSSGGDATSLQIACLAWARTTRSRVQIRKYLGVFPESEITDGTWAGSVRGACQSLMAYHILPQTMTNGLVLRGCAWNGTLARVTYGLSASTAAESVVQRRRRRGRGS